MILSRQAFEYQKTVLIEKVTFRPPFKHKAIFQNQGCFLYFKEMGSRVHSAQDNIEIKGQEAVLLRCGTYFVDFLKETDEENLEVIAIHLYPDILKKLYLKELPALIKKQSYNKKSQVIASQNIIAKFIDSLEFYFDNPTLVNDDLLELKIKELILLLVQSKNVASILELITDLYSTKVVDLKEVIQLHVYSNLTIEKLAQLSNLSLSSFKRAFKKEFNDSPQNYIITKKLEKAQELLRLTDMPISDIAYEIGFNDPLYFTRLFKKKVGTAPTAFRTAAS